MNIAVVNYYDLYRYYEIPQWLCHSGPSLGPQNTLRGWVPMMIRCDRATMPLRKCLRSESGVSTRSIEPVICSWSDLDLMDYV